MKFNRVLRRTTLLLLGASLTSSCWIGSVVPGDRSHDVAITNPNDASVVLFDAGREYPAQSRTLAPHETKITQWLISDDRSDAITQKVEATDSTGRLIFCHRFTYNELTRLKWQVSLQAGQLDCD